MSAMTSANTNEFSLTILDNYSLTVKIFAHGHQTEMVLKEWHSYPSHPLLVLDLFKQVNKFSIRFTIAINVLNFRIL